MSLLGNLLLSAALAACAAGASPDASSGPADGAAAASQNAPLAMVSPLGAYLAGRVAGSENDPAAAARFFNRALADDPDNPTLIHRTMVLEASSGQMEPAIALAGRLIKTEPKDGIANLILATAALHQGDGHLALQRLQVIPHTGLNGLLVPMLAAWAEFGDGRLDAALDALKGLQANAAFAPFYEFHLALLQDAGGHADLAEAAYKKSMTSSGGGALRVVEAYGNFLERQGRAEEAGTLYKDYLKRAPDSPGVKAMLAALQKGQKPKPMFADAVTGAAEAFYGTSAAVTRDDGGNATEIFVHFALYLRPDFELARTLLADIYEANRRWPEAIAVYREIPESSPYSASSRLRIAWALSQLKRTKEAVDLLKQLAAEDPSQLDVLVTLADIQRSDEHFAEAAESYSKAIAQVGTPQPRQWTLFYARGIAYERSKQWPKAEADFLKALELSPEQPLVLNYLGYSWVERGENVDRARAMIERAVQLKPNDGFIVDSLGWALYRLGQYPEAVSRLERAVELTPQDPTINDHLGDAYWRVGRYAEARFQWRRALSLGPEAAQIPIIEGKIEQGLGASAVDNKAARLKNGG